MAGLAVTTSQLRDRYLPLIKSRQTILLAFTGIAGYLCQPPVHLDWLRFTGLAISLVLTISGCTVLNMLFDRDIDCKMERTSQRPLASGRVSPSSAAILGCGFLTVGLIWAAILSLPYFGVILSGAFLNVVVYTLWLKRRTAWSILGGGVAGGMPILAGRVLAIGRLDLLGLLMTLLIVCWIPSHNLALSMLYSTDYLHAGIPTVLNRYGARLAHFLMAFSSFVVSIIILLVFNRLGFHGLLLGLLITLSLGLVSLAVISWVNPRRNLVVALYKFSSLYLLVSTLLLLFSGMM